MANNLTIRPIKTDADHAAAMAQIEALWDAPDGSPESDCLDVLATLVDAYEASRWPIAAPTPVAAIAFRLEQAGLDRKALEPFIGTRARVSEIMNGKRSLTLPMIRRLSVGLGIPADVLVQPDQRKPAEVKRSRRVVRTDRNAEPASKLPKRKAS